MWEERTRQRPAPMQPPRIQNLEYCNMTVRAVEDEEGIQVMSQYKDMYMRSEVQLQQVSDAQADQRKVAGGSIDVWRGTKKVLNLSSTRAL